MFQHDAYKLKGGLRQARLQLAKSENITRDQSIVVKVIIGTLIPRSFIRYGKIESFLF